MDREVLRQWLKAGYLEKDVFFATTDGTPQGGVASPALANRALDGLEQRLAERFGATRSLRERNRVHLVRYADDFIITGTSAALLRDGVRPLVEQFLFERGLRLSHEKTSITHVRDGFDFLGQNVRRYGNGKVLLKPSKRNVRTFLNGIREVIQGTGGSMSAGELIEALTRRSGAGPCITDTHRATHLCLRRSSDPPSPVALGATSVTATSRRAG